MIPMDNKNLTIVFIAFDGYCDLWSDCIKLFHTFWPDCPYKVVFVNNEKGVEDDDFEVVHAGKNAEWSKKVQLALSKVQTPYVCLLLEDFFIGDIINSKEIFDILKFIEIDKIKYYKLVNMNRAVKNHDPIYKNTNYLHIIPESDEYGISLQAAIWDTEYLKKLVGNGNYNAWKFEFDRVHEAQGKADTEAEGCVFDDRNILHLQHAVIQGEYLPVTIKYFKKRGIELNVRRSVMPYRKYYMLRLMSKAKYAMPKAIRGPIKKAMERMGYTFVSTIRDKEE